MRVVVVSKALILSAYRQKLIELARLGAEVVAVVPPSWHEGGRPMQLERGNDTSYRLIVSPMRWNGHYHLHYYPELPSILRNVGPDVLHLDEEAYNLATYLGARAALRLAIPSIFFSWQNISRRYPPPFRQLERAVYRMSSHALAGSSEAKNVLRDKGYSGDITIIPQFGVNPQVFAPHCDGRRGFRVGFFNRMTPEKGPFVMLQAFESLSEDAQLLLVGDGPLRKALEDHIAEQGLRSRVDLRSRGPSNDVAGLMNSIDVLVLPSLTTPSWKEQFGRVLIEAMASGVAVVGSSSGEIPNVIGDAGIVVPEGDAAALGAALSRLQEDAELRAELGRRGRERVLAHFTHARIAEKTYAVYQKALKAP